jgi:CBS domain containing-hemolysin-like protein
MKTLDIIFISLWGITIVIICILSVYFAFAKNSGGNLLLKGVFSASVLALLALFIITLLLIIFGGI